MSASTKTKPVDQTQSALSVSLPRKDLMKALTIAGRGVAARASLPILTHVLIRTDGETGHVRFLGTDLELWIEHTLPQSAMTFGGPGSAATAPVKTIQAIISGLPEKPVSLTASAGTSSARTLRIKCEASDYKLLTLDPEDFPVLPNLVPVAEFRVQGTALSASVRQTLVAVSDDQMRAVLTGVMMSVTGDVLRCVATDTHRLVVRDCPALRTGTEDPADDCAAIVPDKAMRHLLNLLDAASGDVLVTIADELVRFQIDDEKTGARTTLVSRLIDGQYPNWERIVPKSHTMMITLEREALLSCLNRLKIVASEQSSANRVTLRFAEDAEGVEHLTAAAISDNLGVAFERMETARTGDDGPFVIGFNIKYLIAALAASEADGLHLELSDPLRPCVLRQPGDEDGYHVLMPMQTVEIAGLEEDAS